jgi:thioredoxin 1
VHHFLTLIFILFSLFLLSGCGAPQENTAQRGSEAATGYRYAAKTLGQGYPVMFEFGKGSCKACKEMGELIYRIKQQNPHYRLFYIDVGRDRKAAADHGIRMIPTQLFFDRDGNEVYRHVGGFTTEAFIATLRKYGFDAK